MAFRAIEAGALAALPVAAGIGHPEHEESAAELVRTVKLMSEVKVVRRWARHRVETSRPSVSLGLNLPITDAEIAVVAIGASTGGPQALQSIVSGLPGDFPVPVLIVQHIAIGFIDGFVNWLGQSSRLPVRLAAHGEVTLPGNIYVAPDGYHLKAGSNRRLLLSAEEPENGLRPAVASLFRSVAKCYGCSAVGVLLSGMGKDGALELKLMKEQGAVTIAQNMESSVVHGMPGEAIKLGAATYILPPERIACLLGSLVASPARRTTSDL
jgi:two-component system chemotaxis response regulator CheB